MKYCRHCGKEVCDEAVVCFHCGFSIDEKQSVIKKDEVNVGLCILAAFVPIFGLIYWAIFSNDTPKAAKAVGLTALISYIVQTVLPIIIFIFMYLIFGVTALGIGVASAVPYFEMASFLM